MENEFLMLANLPAAALRVLTWAGMAAKTFRPALQHSFGRQLLRPLLLENHEMPVEVGWQIAGLSFAPADDAAHTALSARMPPA